MAVAKDKALKNYMGWYPGDPWKYGKDRGGNHKERLVFPSWFIEKGIVWYSSD